jgi:hypothetical protein
MRHQPASANSSSAMLAQLLALNALFDAARAGEAGRGAALALQCMDLGLPNNEHVDLDNDQHLQALYTQLFAQSTPPSLRS